MKAAARAAAHSGDESAAKRVFARPGRGSLANTPRTRPAASTVAEAVVMAFTLAVLLRRASSPQSYRRAQDRPAATGESPDTTDLIVMPGFLLNKEDEVRLGNLASRVDIEG